LHENLFLESESPLHEIDRIPLVGIMLPENAKIV
jgi:hypothetical protein